MLKRKFYDTLLEWRQTKKKECLLVNGARQIGKTYIIERFGKDNYTSYIYINFLQNPEYREIFDGSLEPSEIYRRMSLSIQGLSMIEHDTLIFLDEIQACMKARTALKFLAIDDRYDVVASGSLLGIHYREDDAPQDEVSIPVGYEHEVEMHSLDFEEFLWAIGITTDAISYLHENYSECRKIDPAVNDKYMQLLREYLFIGGMPDVINTFLATNNYQKVNKAQNKILKAYEDDIEKYAKNSEKPKIKDIYYSIPRQLAKEYTKFQYKTVERNGSSRKYGNSIDWLLDAGLICSVSNVSLPMMPLKAYEKKEDFKIYASDIGLLTCMFGFETQKALLENTLVGPAKGGIYENLIFAILHKKEIPLFYYKNEENTQEIEFIYEKDGSSVPIEVKSNRGKAISLHEFIKKYKPNHAYKLIDGNIGTTSDFTTLPLYMAMFI